VFSVMLISSKAWKTGDRIQNHVFQHGAKLDGVEDLRLAFMLEVDALRVAATLEIEHAVDVQPCSSSPTRRRSGSAERVVLPVPERPKNSATLPSAPTLAEQCMGSTFRSGSM